MTKRVLWVRMATRATSILHLDIDDPHIPFVSALVNVMTRSPGPVLIFGVGPLGGHRGAGLAEAVIAGTSPHSGGVTEARIQGRLASGLRSAGLDAVIVTQPSSERCTVRISENGDCAFESAIDSSSTWDVTDACRRTDVAAVVAAIGHRSPHASIVVDKGSATAIGGLGVTMADLGLQALVLPWTPPSSDQVIDAITSRYARDIASNPLTASEHDAPGFGVWLSSDLAGYVAGGDFEQRLPSVVEEFRAESMLPLLEDRGTDVCPGCPQRCLKSYGAGGVEGGRLHQQSLAAFVAGFGDIDPVRASEFNAACHEWGLEHLSIAAVLRHVGWHTDRPVREQIRAIADHPLPEDAKTVKGMPLSPWDPRGSHGLAVGFALSPTGPHYDILEHDIDFDPAWAWERHVAYGEEFGVPAGGLPVGTLTEERFPSLIQLMTMWSGLTALGVCIYAGPPTRELRLADVLAMVASVTGVSMTREELLELGRVRLALLRDVNARLGVSADADDLPQIFFTEPTANGERGFPDIHIDRIQFESARDYVIDHLGWSTIGGVTRATADRIDTLTRPLLSSFAP